MVIVSANALARPGDFSVAEMILGATLNGMVGPETGISIYKGYSSSAVAIARFDVEAGTYHCSGTCRIRLGGRDIGSTGLVVLGVKR